MTEPATTAVGGLALYKLGAFGLMAVLAAVVVMAMTLPKTAREFVVAMVSTLMFSLGGGAAVIRWFELMAWANDLFGLIALLGLAFVCGLPGWVFVRSWFAYAELRKDKSLIDLIRELRAAAKGET